MSGRFKKDSQGCLYYETDKHIYSLLEGKTNNGLTSDIIFIFKEPTMDELGNNYTGEVIGYVYGGFNELTGIEETIKDYEKKEVI